MGMAKEIKRAEDSQKNEMGQGNPKQHKYKLNDSAGLLELSKGKSYSKPKRGLASISQIIAWQEHQDGMTEVLNDL